MLPGARVGAEAAGGVGHDLGARGCSCECFWGAEPGVLHSRLWVLWGLGWGQLSEGLLAPSPLLGPAAPAGPEAFGEERAGGRSPVPCPSPMAVGLGTCAGPWYLHSSPSSAAASEVPVSGGSACPILSSPFGTRLARGTGSAPLHVPFGAVGALRRCGWLDLWVASGKR